MPTAYKKQAFRHDHLEDAIAIGSKRHANPDLPCSLDDIERERTIDTDAGQQEFRGHRRC